MHESLSDEKSNDCMIEAATVLGYNWLHDGTSTD
jgi:hypothetical protein